MLPAAVVVSPADLEVWLKVIPDHVPEIVTLPELSTPTVASPIGASKLIVTPVSTVSAL